MGRSIKKYKIFHFVIVVYLIAAFSWWAILLSKKTNEIYFLKTTIAQTDLTYDKEALFEEFYKQKKMIFGEGLFFGLSILFSLVFIYRAFLSELNVNKRLNNFLLSVTHELKTPVASLNLINRTLATKNVGADKSKELLDLAWDESNRLESLVSNILTAAQMESSYKFNFESADLSALIRNRIKRFEKLNPSRRIEKSIEDTENIRFDKEAMMKLIDNLLDNAIKYSSADSVVTIIYKRSGKKVQLEVIDKGSGIAAKDKTKVLEKFYRQGNEDTRETKGTGLGLFIVKEISDAHRGQLKILDNKPKGTIIQFLLSV